MPTGYSPTNTGGPSSGGTLGSIATGVPIPAVRTIGSGRNTSDAWVQGYENAFRRELERISQLAAVDPASARTALQNSWIEYVNDARAFNGGLPSATITQSFSNPAFTSTVNTLWQQLGGGGQLTSISPTSIPLSHGKITWADALKLGLVTVPAIIGAMGNGSGGNGQDGVAGGTLGDTASGTPTDPRVPSTPSNPTGDPNWQGPIFDPSGNVVGANNAGGANTAKSIWDQLQPYILAGSSLIPSIYSMIAGSNASEKAAQIQADAAAAAAKMQSETTDKVLGLQREQWEAGRADMAPWLDTGRKSLATLSNLMGLPIHDSTTPYTAQTQGNLNMPFGTRVQSQPAITQTPSPVPVNTSGLVGGMAASAPVNPPLPPPPVPIQPPPNQNQGGAPRQLRAARRMTL